MNDADLSAECKAAEKALLQRVKECLPPTDFAELIALFNHLQRHAQSFSDVFSRVHVLLVDYPQLWEEMKAYMYCGTDIYIYTPPGAPMQFRPYFKLTQVALEWNVPGDNFSKCCAICLNAFTPPIRTLECKHTYCQSCLEEYLEHSGIVMEEGGGPQEVLCPYCKQTNELSATVDSAHERAHNALLLAFQDETLLYKCPINGCRRVFARAALEEHMEVCSQRKYMCDQGCQMVLVRDQLHDSAQDCIDCLRNSMMTLMAQHREKDKVIDDLMRCIDDMRTDGGGAAAANADAFARLHIAQ
jgi:hypothetical protein